MHDRVAAFLDVEERFAELLDTRAGAIDELGRAVPAVIPEEFGAAEILEFLERTAHVAERLELATLRGKVGELVINGRKFLLEPFERLLGLENLRLQRMLVRRKFSNYVFAIIHDL